MGNLRMNADQISYKGGEKPMSVEEAIKNAGNTGLAHTADIAPDFSAESAYNAGDLVYHNGTLYVFTANHAAGAWSSEDTQAVTVGNELSTLMSGLTNIKAGVVEVTAEATAYGYETVSVPYGDTNYSVVLTVGYASNFTEAVLAASTKTGSDVRIGFFNKSNASLTLPVNYVIIPNN